MGIWVSGTSWITSPPVSDRFSVCGEQPARVPAAVSTAARYPDRKSLLVGLFDAPILRKPPINCDKPRLSFALS